MSLLLQFGYSFQCLQMIEGSWWIWFAQGSKLAVILQKWEESLWENGWFTSYHCQRYAESSGRCSVWQCLLLTWVETNFLIEDHWILCISYIFSETSTENLCLSKRLPDSSIYAISACSLGSASYSPNIHNLSKKIVFLCCYIFQNESRTTE